MSKGQHRPTFAFRKGSLCITDQWEMMRITAWPPKAVKKGRYETVWNDFTPKFRLVRPYRRQRKKKRGDAQLELSIEGTTRSPRDPRKQKKAAFDRFRFALPREVAARLEKYTGYQWNALLLLHLVPDSSDLFKSNPALAYFLANTRKFATLLRKGNVDAASTIILSKQRDILNWMKFRSDERMAKIMRKIPAESATKETFERLRWAADDETAFKFLSHLSELNRGVLELVLRNELTPLLTRPLLEEVMADRREKYAAATARILQETLVMEEQLGAQPRRTFRSRESIRLHHNELMQHFIRDDRKQELRCYKFPKPPLPGTQNIVPVTTAAALHKEGKDQHNCVATYAGKVADGKCYIYKVLKPERATLSVAPRDDGEWYMSELKGRCNSDVCPATEDAIDRWLGEYRLSVS